MSIRDIRKECIQMCKGTDDFGSPGGSNSGELPGMAMMRRWAGEAAPWRSAASGDVAIDFPGSDCVNQCKG
jgi:hypothetical protein